MSEKKSTEHSSDIDLSLKELSIGMERLNREFEEVLSQVGLTYEQIKKFLSDPNNFSLTIWQDIQLERKKLDLKLDQALQHVRDPAKVKAKLAERGTIQSHWLFVR